VGPAGLSDVGHGMARHEGSQSNFRVPESRIEPTATPFDESIPQGPVDGDPPSASGSQHPAARLLPSAGFFHLTLAAENERAAMIGSNRMARRTIKSN
jgi:hypothetical protein